MTEPVTRECPFCGEEYTSKLHMIMCWTCWKKITNDMIKFYEEYSGQPIPPIVPDPNIAEEDY